MDQSQEEAEQYEVGYKRPPTHTQFRKGVSGNPHGRKKKVVRPSETVDHPQEETVPYKVGYKQPPTHAQFRKGVTGNPYGRKNERRFVEAILAKVLLSVTAPTPGRRSGSCTNMEAMFRALVMKALEGDVVAFREIMEWVCEFGIGMESRLAAGNSHSSSRATCSSGGNGRAWVRADPSLGGWGANRCRP